MMQPFLIVGLPRSRTAWWSVAATTAISICTHEPLKHCRDFDDLRKYWDRPSAQFVGVSDSGCAYQIGRILADIEPRTLLIERPLAEVEASLLRYFEDVAVDRSALHRQLHEIERHLCEVRRHHLVKTVRFDALCHPSVIQDCFDWLMPGSYEPFRRELMHLNIQVDLAYIKEEMGKPRSNWWMES